MNTLLEDLEWRGLIKDHTELHALSSRLDRGPITLYCGYDPTADSLHMGNLQMVVMLRRFQLAGHRVIALSGGGTGLIGDPSGRTEERQLKSDEIVREWTSAISVQLKRCLADGGGAITPTFVDNRDWIGEMSAVQLLRDVGKHFTINYMLAKDSVSSRIGNEESGLSFTEFSYMLLQAIDYLSLSERFGCELQIGGSDQWGNITAGISLVKKKTGKQVYGLTSPLILRSDGRKFGKSETGAVWLAREKTSPYALYQYFMNIPDQDAATLLKRLTLLDRQEIDSIERRGALNPEQRVPQRALAEEVVRFVHGPSALSEAESVTEWLFGSGSLPEGKSVNDLLAGAPIFEASQGKDYQWVDLLVEAGVAPSKSEARRLIAGGGIYAWDRRVEVNEQQVNFSLDLRENILLISKGKRSKTVVRAMC